jgi:hypothetical protein
MMVNESGSPGEDVADADLEFILHHPGDPITDGAKRTSYAIQYIIYGLWSCKPRRERRCFPIALGYLTAADSSDKSHGAAKKL